MPQAHECEHVGVHRCPSYREEGCVERNRGFVDGVELRGGESVVAVEVRFFFSSRRRHTRFDCDWSSDVCSSDLHELVGHLRRADPLLLLAAVALATLTFPLRTLRWQLILRDVGGKRFPLLPLWHATAIGFMANNLLPVRAGEFARAYAAQQQLPVRFSTALASVGVERVLDGLLLVGLMMLAIASPDFPGHATIGTTSVARVTVGAAVFFGAVLLVAVLVVHRPAPWLALLRRVTYAVLPERLAAPLTRIGEGLIAGLEVLKSPARFSAVFAWSLLQWLLQPAAVAPCLRALCPALPPPGPP